MEATNSSETPEMFYQTHGFPSQNAGIFTISTNLTVFIIVTSEVPETASMKI
jgi:hypothetical protein